MLKAGFSFSRISGGLGVAQEKNERITKASPTTTNSFRSILFNPSLRMTLCHGTIIFWPSAVNDASSDNCVRFICFSFAILFLLVYYSPKFKTKGIDSHEAKPLVLVPGSALRFTPDRLFHGIGPFGGILKQPAG